jgi:hypothetical protein
MTKNQEVIGEILNDRITKEKAAGTLNVDDITFTLNIFLAGAVITNDQYDTFKEAVKPLTSTDATSGTAANTTTSTDTTTQTTQTNTAGTTTTGTETADATAATK